MATKLALITGASGGIGRELARIHAAEKGDLLLVARSEHELGILADELRQKYGVRVYVYPADLIDPEAPRRIFQFAQEQELRVDYLMNNAGFGGYGFFTEREREADLDMIRLNVTALTDLTHLFLPGMIERKTGKILNTASTAGFIPGPLQAVYFATKAYVLSLSQALAYECRKTGVTVTALCPGPVRTGFEKAADLEGSPLFKSAASPEVTARKGYRAMQKGKLLTITDWKLRFGLNWIIPLLPRWLVLKATADMQLKK